MDRMQYNPHILTYWRVRVKRSCLAYSRVPLVLFVLLLAVACIPGSPTTMPEAQITTSQDPWLQVYFTDPLSPSARNHEGGPEEPLVAAISNARLSVDVAAYNFNLWSVRDALLGAQARGVKVRMVAESDNLDGDEFQDLMRAGIEVLGDRCEGLMHNKFIIIDRIEVWTGSMNFTLSGAYNDNNNLVRIRSSRVVQDYLVEFNEMFEQDLFGSNTLARTPYPSVTQDGTRVDVFFSPDDGVQTHLMEYLTAARKSIHFMAYSFTADGPGELIRSLATQEVTVAGVMDADQAASNTGTEFDLFAQTGLDVRLDGNTGQMHHKVIIIDESIVITGSYNFSANAENRNDENMVVFHDPEIASLFLDEFWKIYAQAQESNAWELFHDLGFIASGGSANNLH